MLRRNLANFFTLLNLLSGLIALYFITKSAYIPAFYAFLAGIGFDFLDGLVARMTKTSSELGLQLDSLADMVTSGVVPGYLLFDYLQKHFPGTYFPFSAFLIPLASAWRLARFNIDTRQRTGFIGLPTPANALMIFAAVLSASADPDSIYARKTFLISLIFLSAWLLNAPVRLFALKFKDLQWKGNRTKMIFVVLSILMILWKGLTAIPIIIIAYILVSIVYYKSQKSAL